MSKILIVEDERYTSEYLVGIAKSINPNIDVLSAGTVDESLRIAKEKDIKVFFIDIRLANEDGIELALEIRKIRKYKFSMIVFISSMTDRRLEAFNNIHCYDFLDKNFMDKEDLREAMRNMLVDYLKDFNGESSEDRIVLDFDYKQRYLECNEILFIEYNGRKIYIQTFQEWIEYKFMSLKQFMKQLPNCFVQVSQYVSVNMDNVCKIDKKSRLIKFEEFDKELIYTKFYKKRVEWYRHESI